MAKVKRARVQALGADHRGRACELLDPLSRDLPAELKEALPQPGWRSSGRGAEGHWTLVAGAGLWLVSAVLVFEFVPTPWNWVAASFLPIGATTLALFPPFSRAWRRAAGKAIIETTLRFRLCPGCGYTLKDLAVEGDGCVVCPECGAAWRGWEGVDSQRGEAVSSTAGAQAPLGR